jgi:hypothetical protein
VDRPRQEQRHSSFLETIDKTFDPYARVLSLNIRRRHLTAEQKRVLIANVLKAKPETSNVQIARQVKVDDKTVANVRTGLEATSEIPRLEKTVGKDGKERPTHQRRAQAGKVAAAAATTGQESLLHDVSEMQRRAIKGTSKIPVSRRFNNQ